MASTSECGIFAQIQQRAAETPQASALISLTPELRVHSYAELWDQIVAFGASLDAVAQEENPVVAIAMPDSAELLMAILGTARRFCCAPLNPALTEYEYGDLFSRLEASVLIVDPDGQSAAVHAAERLGVQVLRSPLNKGALEAQSARMRSVSRPFREGSSPSSTRGLEHAAILLHTSGTTGGSKIVALKHKHLEVNCLNVRRVLGLEATDRFLSMMPLFHLQGFAACIAQLCTGGSLICTPGFSAESFPHWLREHKPTWYTAGATLHTNILQAIAGLSLADLPLRFVRSIGAPLAPELLAALERQLQVPVIEGYGMTEGGTVTSNPLPPGVRKPGSAGISAGPEIAIFDEQGRSCRTGVIGEVVARGGSIIDEYYRDAVATSETFRDGWFHTGDLGKFDQDGYLYLTGRLKEVINRGGEKVLPNEVDAVLNQHPDIAEAASFSVEHPSLGEDVACAVVLAQNCSVSDAEIRAFASKSLASFKIPRRIYFVDAIPKGATGKPRRAMLRDQWNQATPAAVIATPAGDLERVLAAVWARILGLDEVRPDQNFFDLGGDSLSVSRMLLTVQQEVAASAWIPEIDAFLQNATSATLARIIREAGEPASDNHAMPDVFTLQANGARIPLFCVPPSDGGVLAFRHLSKRLGGDQPFHILRTTGASHERGCPDSIHRAALASCEILRKVQAHGPYILGGHCYGGMVAFETARRLSLEGHKISLLVLFNTPTPGYPKPLKRWRQYTKEVWKAVRRRDIQKAGGEIVSHAAFLAKLKNRKSIQYSPKAVEFPILHYIANLDADRSQVLQDPRLGWGDFARSGFTAISVPTTNNSLFSEPGVQHLASHLQCALNQI